MVTHSSSTKKASSSLKPFQCQKCTKSYTKLEHLNRHERTHSNSKPFRCNDCGRSFGRQDVLARHARLHGNPQSKVATTPISPPLHQGMLSQMTPSASPAQVFNAALIPTPADEASGHETFQDSEGLLDWLMNGFNEFPLAPLPFTDLSGITQPVDPTRPRSSSSYGLTTSNRRPEAMGISELFKMIDDLSRRLSSEIDNTGITSDFLHSSLHEFFQRISPCFPVIHQPTFSSQKSIPPLLLNMVALGSLYVCLPNAVQKGEILWKLGHTAVATSWQTLMTIRGPHDTCDGVQVVLTALLGQTYALLSSNPDIRRTAFVFHGLGFYWARTCGMYAEEQNHLPTPNLHESDKRLLWEKWAASEIRRRAVLGHYILDGLISQASGSPASARHLINKISPASSHSAFAAASVDEWIVEMSQSEATQLTMSQIYTQVFSSEYASTPLALSSFSVSVVLEGLQSLISEAKEVEDDSVGVVTRQQITQALHNVYEGNMSPLVASNKAIACTTLIRWHTICIEFDAPSTSLYTAISDAFDLPRDLSEPNIPRDDFNLENWANSGDAMRAALHALAIVELVNDVPLSHSATPHLPAAIFSSALVLGTLYLFGRNNLEIPHVLNWDAILGSGSSMGIDLSTTADDFLRDQRATSGGIKAVNILNEMNSLQLYLKSITSRWGISDRLYKAINSLLTLVWEHQGSI